MIVLVQKPKHLIAFWRYEIKMKRDVHFFVAFAAGVKLDARNIISAWGTLAGITQVNRWPTCQRPACIVSHVGQRKDEQFSVVWPHTIFFKSLVYCSLLVWQYF